MIQNKVQKLLGMDFTFFAYCWNFSNSKTRSSNESYNNRVEVYHLEDLENQVIEEKAEEEETSSVYIYSK